MCHDAVCLVEKQAATDDVLSKDRCGHLPSDQRWSSEEVFKKGRSMYGRSRGN